MKNSKLQIALMFILLFLCFNNSFAQNNLIKDIKSSNEKGNFEKSNKSISKYKEKYDTLDFNYKLGLSDYYRIKNNPEYDLRKSLQILNSINCLSFTDKDKGIYFNKDVECGSFLDVKKADFIKSYFYVVEKSKNLDSLKYFISDSENFPEFRNQIMERLAGFVFDYYLNEYNQRKSPKSELIQFVKEFPNTSYIIKAQALIEDIDFRNTDKINTLAAYKSFLLSYPNSIRKEKVLAKIEELSWNVCLESNSIISYNYFLKDFPNSNRKNDALLSIEKLKWKECMLSNTITSYEAFIKEFPSSAKVPKAKIVIENLIVENNFKKNHRTVNLEYTNEINGFRISAIWSPKIGSCTLVTGPAIINLYNTKDSTYFRINTDVFTVTNDNLCEYIKVDSDNNVVSISKENISISFNENILKYTENGNYTNKALFSFEEINDELPFFFLDIDFDSKKELLISHYRLGQRGHTGYSVHKLNSDERQINFEVEPFINHPYPNDDKYFFYALDYLSKIDYNKKAITIVLTGGSCGSDYEIYTLQDTEFGKPKFVLTFLTMITNEAEITNDNSGKCYEICYKIIDGKKQLTSKKKLEN